MITLEDQIRVYATDVAGPAVGEPPADLAELRRPSHRGRWLLVAALMIFIAGLGWVATRPSHSSAPPVVADPITTAPTEPFGELISAPTGTGPCSADGTVAGVLLGGSSAAGLCVSDESLTDGKVLLRVFDNGRELIRYRLSPCTLPSAIGHPPFADAITGGPVLALAFTDPSAAFARFDGAQDGQAIAESFDLPSIPGARVVLARVPDPFTASSITPLDQDGIALPRSFRADAPTCLANDGTPTVTTLPEN